MHVIELGEEDTHCLLVIGSGFPVLELRHGPSHAGWTAVSKPEMSL
jgi:hypothetical protein